MVKYQKYGAIISKRFVWKWTRCSCGCCRLYKWGWMWRVNDYITRSKNDENEYYSAKEYRTLDDIQRLVDIRRHSHAGSLSMIVDDHNLSVDDYMSMRYNIHTFTVRSDSYLREATYYLLRVQEFPGVEVMGADLGSLNIRIKDKMENYIESLIKKGEKVPVPEDNDPRFRDWE